MSRQGEINGWRCRGCGGVMYAIHVNDGVTPMFLNCRATPGCQGDAVSLMYPSAPPPRHVVEAVAWEWYEPTGHEYRKLDAQSKDHVDRGGLLLRKLTDVGRRLLPEVPGG